jgi:hypothetical protein
MRLHQFFPVLLSIATLAVLPAVAHGQSQVAPEESFSVALIAVQTNSDLAYTRPTQATKLRNYALSVLGPYPIAESAVVAGVGQMDNTPPAWKQGMAGYSRRFGSELGIGAISATTHYALAQAFQEDTLYYRCECKGLFPRLGHALVSTFTARHGEDGRRAFSYSAVAAPYVGAVTGVYAWYPDNYGFRSGLRLGNYNLLGSVGENILLEFFYSGPHSLLSRMHLHNPHAAPDPGSR